MADPWVPDNGGPTAAEGIAWDAPKSEQAETAQPTVDPQAGNEEYHQLVKEKGWAEPLPYDYKAYETAGGQFADWHGAAKRYEWSDEFGDVAPRVPQLEELLFGGEFRMKQGGNFKNLETFEMLVEGPKKLVPIRDFDDAGLHPVVLENLKLCGYSQPTPIQSYCIPAGLQGTDLIAVAQTGSGKTSAYMIPVISRLMGKAKKLCAPKPNVTAPGYNPKFHKIRAEPLVVIVVPTRELAIQIFDEARRMCYRSMLRPAVVYGGLPPPVAAEDLAKGADILIATPGRLVDLMDKPHLLSFQRVKYTIIDEADEMLDDDWEIELKKIMSGGDMNDDADHVFMLFSATFPKKALALAQEYLTGDHYRIQVGRSGSTHKNIQQDVVWVEGNLKYGALWDLITTLEPGRTIIFCNSRKTVDLLDDFLYNRRLPTTSIHSARNQREREDALRSFRTGKNLVLIATGVSARGWDIKDVNYVINFDLPTAMHGGIDEYVHRIGRTARIGHTGKAISFYNDRNEDIAKALANTLVESECQVPEFLSRFVHHDGKAHFEESDEETGDGSGAEKEKEVGASSWGGTAAGNQADGSSAAVNWGENGLAGNTSADAVFKADDGASASNGW